MASVWQLVAVREGEFAHRQQRMSSISHKACLTTLHQAIKLELLGKLTSGVILLHDNVSSHKAKTITSLLQKFK
ncbi:hypothetical protein C0J52_11982 [Blattella germanica]|nr:hypothetical protein C0J52_11982 [Blattella germanica]